MRQYDMTMPYGTLNERKMEPFPDMPRQSKLGFMLDRAVMAPNILRHIAKSITMMCPKHPYKAVTCWA
jgi:hypothetical protein